MLRDIIVTQDEADGLFDFGVTDEQDIDEAVGMDALLAELVTIMWPPGGYCFSSFLGSNIALVTGIERRFFDATIRNAYGPALDKHPHVEDYSIEVDVDARRATVHVKSNLSAQWGQIEVRGAA